MLIIAITLVVMLFITLTFTIIITQNKEFAFGYVLVVSLSMMLYTSYDAIEFNFSIIFWTSVSLIFLIIFALRAIYYINYVMEKDIRARLAEYSAH